MSAESIVRLFDKKQPYPRRWSDLGEAVTRVNKYRTEMGMATRASYESYNYRKGEPESWKELEDQVANSICNTKSIME